MKHGWLLFIFLLGACSAKEEAGETDKKVEAIPVVVAPLSTQTFDESITVTAVAEPIHEVRVSAEAPGRVVKAPFEEGATVKKGALLLRVDAQLDAARINLLKSQIATANRELARTKMLAKEGVATSQQLDQAQSAYDSAQLNLKQAQVGIGKSTVRSPMSGWIAKKMVEEGEYVGPGAPLAHIVDYETIVVRANVNESDVRAVAEGSEVTVKIPALDKTVAGKVFRRGIVAADKTRTFAVEIHVANADREILPGMQAQVVIPRKQWVDAIVVPRDAVLQGFDNEEAMVLSGTGREGKSELRRITIGPAKGNLVVVTEGLSAGDRLIVKGHRSIVDGTLVGTAALVQYLGLRRTGRPSPLIRATA